MAALSPSVFREISQEFFDELLVLLGQGRQLALIAPRQSGKALVLYELCARSSQLPAADRPLVVSLRSIDFHGDSRETFTRKLAERLGVAEAADDQKENPSLAAQVLDLLRNAVTQSRAPFWLFVQNITELSGPFARALLMALQSAAEDSEFRGKFAAVMTGGQDFVPLTYDVNSPYRHAEKFFLQGFDRELTRRFFRARIAGASLHDGFGELPPDATPAIGEDAIDFLLEQTGGYSRFIEEIVLTESRLTPHLERNERSRPWTRRRVEELIERFLREHMRFDQYCRLSLRDVERNADAWRILEQLAETPQCGVRLDGIQPHLLETSGIARRKGSALTFASPMWERFLRALFTVQYRADTYARLGRWDRAWNMYSGLRAADCDRPLDGDERYRLDSVIGAWEDYLVEVTTEGLHQVARHFLMGARHLYGCDSGVLFDQASRRVIYECHAETPSRSGLFVEGAIYQIQDHAIELRLTAQRDALESAPRENPLLEQSEPVPLLQLRRAQEREFDMPALDRMRRSLRRFWLAYMTAERMEHASLRQRHLQVVAKVDELLSYYPGDMRKVVEGTVDALLDIAGYYRILICLVSPPGDRIQAVAGRCKDASRTFNFRTDYSLEHSWPERDWDIHKWVAIKGKTVAVDDACAPDQHSPRTNVPLAININMRGIAVVPMKIVRTEGKAEEILGTIHFERVDQLRPSEVELRSFEILAGQIAVAFDHARRQTMLEQALHALKSEFRVVSPSRRVIFENRTAIEEGDRNVHAPRDAEANRPLEVEERRFYRAVIDDADKARRGVHRYEQDQASQRAFDDFAAPIKDWRDSLDGVFKSDGMLGFVHQSFELTDFVRIQKASQHWLSVNSPRETAKRILDYFQLQEFRWCRIYLFNEQQRLESFEEFGIDDPIVKQQFREGRFFIECSDTGQQAFFLMDVFPDVAELRVDPTLKGPPVVDNMADRGIPAFRTKDSWRQEFQKSDERWLEAPLIVGDQKIGLIALEKPHAFSLQAYQMLRWCILGVAVALHNALDAERRIRLEAVGAKEEAWKSAAQLAIHQLANKLAPAESECHFVQSWLRSEELAACKGHGAAMHALNNAQRAIAFGRGILLDFRRYASDELFKDVQAYRIDDLLKHLRDHLKTVYPSLNMTVEPNAPEGQVLCSRSALLEVFEVLAHNSQVHSRLSPPDLRVSIAVERLPAIDGSKQNRTEEVRFVYSDNGCGISDRDRPRIFDAFYTTSQKGNGLGLAIARRFMHRQVGRITEEGTEESGARFCLYLTLESATK